MRTEPEPLETAAPVPAAGDDSHGSLLLFAAAGLGIYAALKILEPSIAFPLRQISSSLATWFLNALSIQSTLEGTAITTGQFTFDVNPDCSGSTSLRIMLTLGALWFGMYPNLTLARRLICLALAAPIAIVCNALRVTALVMLGNGRGEPVEGFPHEMVGIASFAVAMGVVYLMTLLMAKEPEVVRRIGPRAHVALLVLALGICYAPVLIGPVLFASHLPLALARAAFVMVGLGLLFLARGAAARGATVRSWIPVGIFVLSLGVLFFGTMTDVMTLASVSFLGVLFAITLYLRGWGFALRAAPLLGAVLVGLPGMHNFLVSRLAGRTSEDGYGLTILAESVLALALVGVFLSLNSRQVRQAESVGRKASPLPDLGATPVRIFIVVALMGTLFQTYFNSQAATFDKVHQIKIPLVINGWQGVELQPSAAEIKILGRERIISREYRREDSEPVLLLANATGADRGRAHRPEECMINRGWSVSDQKVIVHSGPAGDTPMSRLTLRREGQEMEMRYWLADPEGEVYGNIAALRPVDVTRRLTGRRTDWRVFRVFGRPGSPAIGEFLDELLPTQTTKGRRSSGGTAN